MHPKLFFSDVARIEGVTTPAIHQRVKDKKLTYKEHKGRAYVEPEIARQIIRKDIKKQVISVHTTKGGVGKTTIALNLAYRLWSFGAKVLVIDLDQQANLTKGMQVDGTQHQTIQNILEGDCGFKDAILSIKKDLDLIPSNLKNAFNTQYMASYGIFPDTFLPKHINDVKDVYDIVIIDCPPALGHIIQTAYLASDRILSILDPDDNALDGVCHSLSEVEKINKSKDKKIDFKLLLNKYDARTIFSSAILNELKTDDNFKGKILETIIRTSQEYLKAKGMGETIFDFNTRNKAFLDIDNLARELLDWPTSEDNKS